MTKDILIDQIIENSLVKSEILGRLRVLKNIVNLKVFTKSGTKNTKTAYSHLTPSEIQWLESLPKTFLAKLDKKSLEIINQSEDELTSWPILTVSLPLDLPDEALLELTRYLGKSHKGKFLLEIKLNPSLVAGAALAWNGVYKDYSIKDKLQASKKQILSICKTTV